MLKILYTHKQKISVTYLSIELIPFNVVLFEKRMLAKMVQKFLAIYETDSLLMLS